jgi:predicted enzyme related to lactoylglutathione lyase
MVVISANNLAESSQFYAHLFGWQGHPMSAELTAIVAPGGPTVSLRANTPEGFQGMVPFVSVPDVERALAQVVAAGGTVERGPWSAPMIGKLARFRDPSGTIYGLTGAVAPAPMPHQPMPVGSNQKPAAGAVCHLEMYATDGKAAGHFCGELFGWGTAATMPHYQAFDPGAGPGGIFQSHTPSLPALAYIYEPDVAQKLTAVDRAGGKRIAEPMRIEGYGCFGYFKDPSGTTMGLIGP